MSRLQPRSFSRSVFSRAHELLSLLHDHLGSGTLRPELAHQLFDEMLCQHVPVSGRALNGLFAALACVTPSTVCPDGPALAIALFRRMARTRRCREMKTTSHTYNIMIDCCCRARRPDIGPAFFGCLLKTGVTADVITFTSVLKCLCDIKQIDEALYVLLHRMPDDLPNVISYSIILKSFCNNGRSQCALDLLRLMAKKGANHSPNEVSYNMVIDGFFKEGEISKAFDLFHKMIQQGIVPNVVTYTSIIDGLCKARAIDKAEVVLRQMVVNGLHPSTVTYSSLIHAYSTSGKSREVVTLLKEMRSQGVIPDVVTCNSLITYLCKHRRFKEAAEIFHTMGGERDLVSYSTMLHGYATEGSLVDMIDLCELMVQDGLVPDLHVYHILIDAYAKWGSMDVAMVFFEDMLKHGVNPNEFIYLSLIAAFCRMGRMDEAMKKFNEMIDMGVSPDSPVYRCMIDGYFKNGDPVKANELIAEMKNKDIHHRSPEGNTRTQYR